MSSIFKLLFVIHCLGQYYFKEAVIKSESELNKKVLFKSICIYLIPVLVSIVLIHQWSYVFAIGAFSLLHCVVKIIGYIKKKAIIYPSGDSDYILKVNVRYFADLFIHILIMVIISLVYLYIKPDFQVSEKTLSILNISQSNFELVINVISVFIVVLKPVSVTFYNIFNVDLMAEPKVKAADDDGTEVKNVKGAGQIIGYMERFIMVCLLIQGDTASLGLIIAAKTIIRLNSNIKQEFFIIGTFYAIISSIVIYALFFFI